MLSSWNLRKTLQSLFFAELQSFQKEKLVITILFSSMNKGEF